MNETYEPAIKLSFLGLFESRMIIYGERYYSDVVYKVVMEHGASSKYFIKTGMIYGTWDYMKHGLI